AKNDADQGTGQRPSEVAARNPAEHQAQPRTQSPHAVDQSHRPAGPEAGVGATPSEGGPTQRSAEQPNQQPGGPHTPGAGLAQPAEQCRQHARARPGDQDKEERVLPLGLVADGKDLTVEVQEVAGPAAKDKAGG